MQRTLMLTFLTAMLGLAGCQPDVPVKTQEVRRLNATQRCLGAVVFPQGERSSKIWVFKLIGPEYPVDAFKPAFEDFILRGGISFNERKEVELKLPEGWKEEKGPKNAVKLLVSVKDMKEPLEIVVQQRTMRRQIMPGQGSFMRYDVQRRTNNWRRELGLKNDRADVVSYFYTQYPLGEEASVFLVNMTGPGHDETAVFTELQFDLPSGWVEVAPKPAVPGIPPAKLAILIQEDDKKASFTLSIASGDIHTNVDRWRDQVNNRKPQLKPLDDREKKEIDAMLQDIDVAGMKGKYVDLQGPRPKEEEPGKKSKNEFKDNRILGVILGRGEETWFFKLTGPDDLIDKQVNNFKDFVRSFAFAE